MDGWGGGRGWGGGTGRRNRRCVVVVVVGVIVVVVAATDHRRQCSCANLARGANSKGSQKAPFVKRKGCPTA